MKKYDNQLQLEEDMLLAGRMKFLESLEEDPKNNVIITSLYKDNIIKLSNEIIDYRASSIKETVIDKVLKIANNEYMLEFDLAFLFLSKLFPLFFKSDEFNSISMYDLFKKDFFGATENDIPNDLLFKFFVIIVNLFIKCTKKTVIYEDKSRIESKNKSKESRFVFTDEFISKIHDKIELIASMSTSIKPMIESPKNWGVDGLNGGYFHKKHKRCLLKGIKIGSGGLDLNITSTVNVIQKTGWVVDKENLDLLKFLNTYRPTETLKSSFPSEPVEPVKPNVRKEYKKRSPKELELMKAWWFKSTKYEKDLQGYKSKLYTAAATAKQSEEFKCYDNIYFPHDLDYRGRVYNIPMTGLSTQGADISKGMMMFSKGRRIETEGGIRWMKINLANLIGHDKLALDERVNWVDNNFEYINDIFKDPKNNIDWHSHDKPFQSLQAIRSYIGWVKDKNYINHTHIQLDGLCNGMQHLTAITRDHIVAPHVGLIKTLERGDIYLFVLNVLKENLHKHENVEMVKQWLTSGIIDRKLTKTPVMTRSYGSTLFGIKNGVGDLIIDHDKVEHFENYLEARNWMGEQIWKAMQNSLGGAMTFMDWVHECSKLIGKKNLPLRWSSPMGLKCVHRPVEFKSKQTNLKIYGKPLRYRYAERTDKIKTSKIVSSSSPNIIHSYDGSHLNMTINRCAMDGIKDFAVVHDSFGVHPDDCDFLLNHAKQAWIDIYSNNQLDILYKNFKGQNDKIPHYSEFIKVGELDCYSVLDSEFFFA